MASKATTMNTARLQSAALDKLKHKSSKLLIAEVLLKNTTIRTLPKNKNYRVLSRLKAAKFVELPPAIKNIQAQGSKYGKIQVPPF